MPDFEYDLGGQTARINVSDDLAAWHRARPEYVEVVDIDGEYVPVSDADAAREAAAERHELEAQAAELAGANLDKAVKAAKIAHPSALTADEKRAALVDSQLADTTDTGDAGDTKEN